MHGHRIKRLTHDFEILRLMPDFEMLRLAWICHAQDGVMTRCKLMAYEHDEPVILVLSLRQGFRAAVWSEPLVMDYYTCCGFQT